MAADLSGLPAAEDDEGARALAPRIARLLGASGWFDAIRDRDLRGCCLIREMLGATSSLADAVFALQALGTTPLLLDGRPELEQRWVGPALRGEAIAAFAMTEPEAGSDVASLSTSAVREGDHYVLNGRKTFISNAGIADFYSLFASTDPERGTRGITCFVVPADTPGLVFAGPQVLSEPHPLGELRLEDCRLPADHVLGAEGGGFKIGMATLDQLRPTVGAAACGMATRALEEALFHALDRRQFGQPLAEFQVIQEKLGRMYTDLVASRLLVYRSAWEKDQGADRITLEAALAKSFSTESAQRIIDEAVQILGGRGVLADNPVDRLYRSVRALRIYEGTTEIQRMIIARALLNARSTLPEAR
jgi:acyl-CoA dehydrogenase